MSTATGAVSCASCGASVSGNRCEKCGAAVRCGRYQVTKVLAQSPHSRAYVAVDDAGREVALKELLFATVPSVQQFEAFEREGKVLQALDHPQIPRFLETFRDGEGASLRLYLAQELVEGEPLSEKLHAGAFDEAQAFDVARQVLEVLAYLHGRTPKLIHRDVKPHNLIARADGKILLVDFGAARELQAAVTHQATLVGTYGYMPPDQLAGTVDETSDLYALGATLMHLLTGRPPDKLVGEDLELAAGISLNVSPGFDKFVRRLAAKLPAKRFQSAAEALAALDALGGPVKRAKKRRAPLVAALALALVAIAAGGSWAVLRTMYPPPPPVVRVYAWELQVTLYEDSRPDSALPASAAFPIGTELWVDRLPAQGELGYLKVTAPRQGYVRTFDVRAQRPDYGATLEAARTALGAAQLDQAEREGERARALGLNEREPLALLGALYGAMNRPTDAQRIAELVAKLGPVTPAPAPTVPPLSTATPVPGERWFVGASKLRARRKASTDARVAAELAINTEVEVVALEGDWAKVKFAKQTAAASGRLEFSLLNGASAEEETAAADVEGYVAQAFLVREHVEKDWTLSRADAALKGGDLLEGQRQLMRAAALDPNDRDLQLRLASLAVTNRDYPVAATAAVAVAELGGSASQPMVELKLAYRCRGDRARAEFVDDSHSPDAMPQDACVGSLEPKQCEPCDCASEGDLPNGEWGDAPAAGPPPKPDETAEADETVETGEGSVVPEEEQPPRASGTGGERPTASARRGSPRSTPPSPTARGCA